MLFFLDSRGEKKGGGNVAIVAIVHNQCKYQ